jgi:hypothetical protein
MTAARPSHAHGVARRAVLRFGAALAITVALAPAARANDPMRPLAPDAAGAPAAPTAATPSSAPTAPVAPPPALLATRRGADGRWEALVDRRWLRTGDRLGGAAVAEVHGDRLVLARAGRRETLWLLPPLTPQRPSAVRP